MLLATNVLGHCRLFDCDTGVLQHTFGFEQSFGAKKKAANRKKFNGLKGSANEEEAKDAMQAHGDLDQDSVMTTE